MIKSKKYILLFSIIFLFFTIFGWEDKTFGADTTLSNGFIFPSTQPGTIGVSDSNGQTSYSTQLPNGTTQTTLYGPNGQTTTTITPTPVQKPQTKAPQTSNTSAKDINYTPLASIPSTNGTGDIGSSPDIGTYFNQMYQLGVGVATALAVLMVIWGGVEYITTDAIGGKEEGKQKVQNAILGLLLALGSYLILQTINPALLNTNLNITKIKTTGAKAPVVSQGGVTNAWANWTKDDQTAFNSAYTHGVDPIGMTYQQMKDSKLSDAEINAVYKEQLNQSTQNVYNNSSIGSNPGTSLSSLSGGSEGALLTSYGYAGDLTSDTNSSNGIGNKGNALTTDSVALSPDVISRLNPQPGAAVYVGGTFVGYYDDSTAASYKGVPLTNRVDKYDPSGSLGGNNFSLSSGGQITVDNSNIRPQLKK